MKKEQSPIKYVAPALFTTLLAPLSVFAAEGTGKVSGYVVHMYQ